MTEEKGFVIRDRRFSSQEQQEKKEEGKPAQAEAAPAAAKDDCRDVRPGKAVEEADARKAADCADKAAEKRGREQDEIPLPSVNFSTFVVSLSSSVLVHLGVIEDPESGRTMKLLPIAKQTLDILGMMEEKTRGNLTTEEEQLLRNILYDLRMRYVREAG
ncbi:MAG: DUF1844 domain-containing protein [Proteobacteria bacterium]|nr:DUF1844 domain-containing protein [Pseudomonadota bacterium]